MTTPNTEMSGHLLCILPIPEPRAMIESLQGTFPGLKVTYLQRGLKMILAEDEELTDAETWRDVTILFTLSHFPLDLALAPKLSKDSLESQRAGKTHFDVADCVIELVHLCSSGSDHIVETPIYKQTAVPIATCAGAPAPVIAEWVMMHVLTASHKYDTVQEWQSTREWNDGAGKAFFGSVSSARGKRFGVLGYGAIGRQTARLASSFGMEVVACTATPRESLESRHFQAFTPANTGDPEGTIPARWFHGTTKSSLAEFLDYKLDYVLISLPLTRSTKQLLGEAEIAILSQHNTFVINVSRGEIIEQDALLRALKAYEASPPGQKAKGIAGAALDVAIPEPLPRDHPLWGAPNCHISPHISGYSREYWPLTFEILTTNMHRLRDGEKLLNQIDRGSGYQSYAGSSRPRNE